MKAAEWDTCTDLETMLKSVRRRANDRKLLLFACGCLRRIWHLLPDRRHRRLIEVAERHADGRTRPRTVADAIAKAKSHAIRDLVGNRGWSIASALAHCLGSPDAQRRHAWGPLDVPRSAASGLAYHTFHTSGQDRGKTPAYQMPLWLETEAAEAAVQRDLFRCVLGNPFRRPPDLDAGWQTWHDGLLLSMAQRMYDSRDFTELPVLADMLEDAGCREASMLAHCRGPGPHARGCFVLDLLRSPA
jgi:hypothetical protein